jgi:hypothetical protein
LLRFRTFTISRFTANKKLVLRESGLIDPENIEEYIVVGGYSPLLKALFGELPRTGP